MGPENARLSECRVCIRKMIQLKDISVRLFWVLKVGERLSLSLGKKEGWASKMF